MDVRKGAYLGLADGEPRSRRGETSTRSPGRWSSGCSPSGREVLTLLSGEDAPELDGLLGGSRSGIPEVELDVQDGGQPHYPLLLSAE